MEDNINYLRENGEWAITLTWDLHIFAPYAFTQESYGQERTIPDTIREVLYAAKNSGNEDYWSVGERLLDLRWVQECITRRDDAELYENSWDTGQSAEFDNLSYAYMKAESGLFYIVSTFRKWLDTAAKNWPELINLKYAEEAVAEKEAKQVVMKLEDLINRTEADPSGLIESYEDIVKAAELVKKIKASDGRKRNLKRTCDDLIRAIGEFERLQRSQDPSQSGQEIKVGNLFLEFMGKAKDFFENPQWRNKNPAVAAIKKLQQSIQVFWKEYHFIDVDGIVQDSDRMILQHGLQTASDLLLEELFREQDGRTAIERLQRKIDGVIEKIKQCATKPTKKLEDYFSDKKRCVALIDIYRGDLKNTVERIIAFSGYFDCEDAELRSKVNGSEDHIEAFQKIADKLGAELAYFSADVVDRVKRYELDGKLKLTARGPLRKELGIQAKDLKREYSCCERKILAKMEINGRKISHCNAYILVKFMPCILCYGALDEWKKTNHLAIDLRYPRLEKAKP